MTTRPGMLTVHELAPEAMAAWDAFVERCGDATFFHLSGWKHVIEASFGHRTHFLFAADASGIRGVLPLVHVKSRLFGNALISAPFGVYGGPAADGDEAVAALDRHALTLADRLNVDHVEYRSRTHTRPDWACKDDVYATFRRVIRQDPDENLKAIPRKQRAVVRKSLESGLCAEAEDNTHSMYRLYAQSVRNLGTPVFSPRYFRALKEQFGRRCEVLVVRRGARLISGVLSFYFRDTVLPYYAGGTPEARKLGAFDFMYWDVMRRSGLAGYRIFDFGRSKVGTGAFHFKRNWGFDPEPLSYEYKLRRGGAVPNLSPLNPKYRLFVQLWRRLPLPIANAVGPVLARDLG
jgi:FemAB-related protein (PEP-CTERM system-associated)